MHGSKKGPLWKGGPNEKHQLFFVSVEVDKTEVQFAGRCSAASDSVLDAESLIADSWAELRRLWA